MTPYDSLRDIAFWRKAVTEKTNDEMMNLWDPVGYVQSDSRYATYGSCFAQHIGKALVHRNLDWVDAEPAPYGLRPKEYSKFNYSTFSSRTGNIYTSSLLLQWLEWAVGDVLPPDEYWEQDGRIFDPFRPMIEPNGFSSIEEMRTSRQTTIGAFKKSIELADCFVFTLGLTECWRHETYGYEYPMCPGIRVGHFDAHLHSFENQNFTQVLSALEQSLCLIKQINPKIKIILTVSPVPLIATQSGEHVLVATSLSKSILRAVAGEIENNDPNVKYFPSFEIITNPVFEGRFYEENKRSVSEDGVAFVMRHFFGLLEKPSKERMPLFKQSEALELICEEELLDGWNEER
ncbi:MAG: GSCFA domain-containing protein [Roseobacter sp.]